VTAGFLLDTNVVSELVKATPAPPVVEWVGRQAISELYLSVVTLGELTRGVVRLADGRKRRQLTRWITEELPAQFTGRLLGFDQPAAVIWGTLLGNADRNGRPYAAIDAQIAAIALRHELTLVTRNTRDFAGIGVGLLNPWEQPPGSVPPASGSPA